SVLCQTGFADNFWRSVREFVNPCSSNSADSLRSAPKRGAEDQHRLCIEGPGRMLVVSGGEFFSPEDLPTLRIENQNARLQQRDEQRFLVERNGQDRTIARGVVADFPHDLAGHRV